MINRFTMPTETNPNAEGFSSIQATSRQEKMRLYEALTANTNPLKTHTGQTLYIKDVVVTPVTHKDDHTGECRDGYRVILVDDKGVPYHCSSMGVYNAIMTAIQIFGEPTWDDPIPFKVVQIESSGRRVLTLTM